MQTINAIPINYDYDDLYKKLSRREKRKLKGQNNLRLKKVEPITDNQTRAFTEYYNGKNLLLHGVAGSGKTYISLFSE